MTKKNGIFKQGGNENSPHLSVLVAEVDQAGNVEEQLDKVVQHEQDQTQTVQTARHRETCFSFITSDRSNGRGTPLESLQLLFRLQTMLLCL